MKIDDKHVKLWIDAEKAQKEKEMENRRKMNPITNFVKKNVSNNNVKKWSKSSPRWNEATNLIAQWLCGSSRPSELVNDPGFRKLIEYLAPEYEGSLSSDYDKQNFERV